MSLRYLRILALLIFALSVSCYAQSLGDLARQTREQEQQKGMPRLRVITNEDLEVRSKDQSRAPETNEAEASDEKGTADTEKKDATSDAAAPEKKSAKKVSPEDAAKEREAARELEAQKRTKEINDKYLGRVNELRSQMAAAQADLARLQRDQLENAIDYRRSSGISPNYAEFGQAQKVFDEQIAAKRELIQTLTSQLEDAREAARHAGVTNIPE